MRSIQIVDAVMLDPDRVVRPVVTTWTRLEPLPLSTDLEPALSAAIADPLWLLCRQWQFLEFAGEDTGTPIDVRIEGQTASLSRLLAGAPGADAAAHAIDYDTVALPLEVAVESETALALHPRLAAEAGLQLQRMLTAAELSGLRDAFVSAYALTLAEDASAGADTNGSEWLSLAAGRALDARRLAAVLRPLRAADGSLSALPPQPVLPAESRGAARDVLQGWLAWYDALLIDTDANAAWNVHRLEYAFATSAPTPDGALTLVADEYADGRLDWHALRAAAASLGEGAADATAIEALQVRPLLPMPVQYAGKPADRYWEFEDETINFGALAAGPTDLTRLLLAEFGLVYGNDWFIVPLRLPVGSITRVARCLARDTFGVVTEITRSRNSGGIAWALFELTDRPPSFSTSGATGPAARDWLLLAPTLAQTLEGDAVEQVALFRDESANMAWAVEHVVQGASGDPYPRYDEASRRAAQQQVDGPPLDAQLVYRLATSVPEHWLPLVPVPAEGSNPGLAPVIQFQRRALLRVEEDGTRRAIQPRGQLLRTDPRGSVESEPALRVEEEEIGREGVIVERNFQLARWLDGRTLLWLGRRKSVGRGEGASGLRFDALFKG
jgi:hypothetical protein